jgi:hypothetical protein
MSVQVAPEIRVRWEIWRSFESCLRSYAAAEGLSDSEVPMVNALGDHIDVTWHGLYLGFTMKPADGTAVWLLEWDRENSMWGGFELLPEGAFSFENGKKDLDHAAIDFLAMLKRQIAKRKPVVAAPREVIQ